jgi:hypothetical protein
MVTMWWPRARGRFCQELLGLVRVDVVLAGKELPVAVEVLQRLLPVPVRPATASNDVRGAEPEDAGAGHPAVRVEPPVVVVLPVVHP